MAQSLIITAPGSMTSPIQGNPKLALRGDITTIASDGFSGPAGALAGRIADAAQGGQRKAWTVDGVADAWAINGAGKLAVGPSSSGTYFAYFQSAAQASNREVEMSIRVGAMPSANINLDMFRDVVSAPESRKLRLILQANGTASLTYSAPTASGETTTVPGAGFVFAAADLLSLRFNTQEGRYTLKKNDITVREGDFTPPRPLTGNMFGFAGTGGMTAGALDDFRLIEVVL